ncbi:MAG: 23S rRNA (guanosine(2251)-2'-O)-methyltransferase RlmB [Methylococcaceae bacterium]|nr:MAG: 23S rRNA (guanosine(2251)-2'-O)-methyltransferase RlmB [Methylococcaceae bacterium]
MSVERTVCGLHAAQTALEHTPDKVVAAWLDGQRSDARIAKIRQALESLGITVQQSDRRRLDKMAGGVNHQGVILRVQVPAEQGENALLDLLTQLDHPPLFLVLDQVQDPHNLGACLRTADAAGVDGVIVTKDQSVALTPTVFKVASGAAETVPVFRVTNLARTLRDLKDAGVWITGAAGDAPQSVYQTDLKGPLALVVGGEGKGMRRLTREHCDVLVSLPMRGQVESLNLSVAAGVLLYEAVRQRALGV